MRLLPRSVPWLAAAAVLLLGSALASDARAISFGCITNNNAGDCAIAESQITLDVTDAGGGNVDVTISNSGSDAAVAHAVYFDGSILDSIVSITNGPGVDFSEGGSPPNLPGGNTVGFVADLLATANPAPPQNGVGPGEQLTIRLAIASGSDFADVLSALSSGDLRVGIHVIAFESGGSESLVNVPEPAALGLLGVGLVALARRGARR